VSFARDSQLATCAIVSGEVVFCTRRRPRSVAAVAAEHRATILHYDRDFDQVAEVTGEPVRWVVRPGSGHQR
jgi:predicted nucleic acid-binding protein